MCVKKKLKKGLIGMLCLLSIQMLLGCMGEAFAAPSLDITQVTLSVGEKVELTVCDADKAVKWSSSNRKVATVSRKGVVKAKKKGKAKITAKVGKKRLTCRVKVVNGKSKKNVNLILNAKKVTMDRGSSYTLEARAYPKGAGGKLTWKSSKKSVASVSKNGVIRARKPGKAVISVYSGSKKKKASCMVVVKKKKGSGVTQVLNPVFSKYQKMSKPESTGTAKEGTSQSGGYPVAEINDTGRRSESYSGTGSSASQSGTVQNTPSGKSSNMDSGRTGNGQPSSSEPLLPVQKKLVSIDVTCNKESVPSGYRFRIDDFVVTEFYSDGTSSPAGAFSVSVETKNSMNTITITDQGMRKTLYVPCIPGNGEGTGPESEPEEALKVSVSLNPATVNVGENLSDGQLLVTLIDAKTGQNLGQTKEYTTDFTPQMAAGNYPFHVTCRGITLTVRAVIVDPAQSIQSISVSYNGPHGRYLVMEEGVDPDCLNITAVMGDGSSRTLAGSEIEVNSVEMAAYDGDMTKVHLLLMGKTTGTCQIPSYHKDSLTGESSLQKNRLSSDGEYHVKPDQLFDKNNLIFTAKTYGGDTVSPDYSLVWLENGFQTTFDPKNRPGTYQAQLTCQGRTWYTFAIIVDQEE